MRPFDAATWSVEYTREIMTGCAKADDRSRPLLRFQSPESFRTSAPRCASAQISSGRPRDLPSPTNAYSGNRVGEILRAGRSMYPMRASFRSRRRSFSSVGKHDGTSAAAKWLVSAKRIARKKSSSSRSRPVSWRVGDRFCRSSRLTSPDAIVRTGSFHCGSHRDFHTSRSIYIFSLCCLDLRSACVARLRIHTFESGLAHGLSNHGSIHPRGAEKHRPPAAHLQSEDHFWHRMKHLGAPD